jgi:hypothetical protein
VYSLHRPGRRCGYHRDQIRQEGDTLKPLSGLDSLFLHLETPATPMHVGAAHLLELPKGYRGDYVAEVKRHVARRLHLSPVFTRQLAPMPLDFANPVWIRADRVDLDRHVLRVRLPKPGTMAQLKRRSPASTRSRSIAIGRCGHSM